MLTFSEPASHSLQHNEPTKQSTDMKAILTFETGERVDADIYFKPGKTVRAATMERDFIRQYNRHTPPTAKKLVRVKIFRTGSVRLQQELTTE